MDVIELDRGGPGVAWALIFRTDDEVISLLRAHARSMGIRAAHFSALGAFREARLAFFDWETKAYQELPVEHQVEVTSLTGDVATTGGEPEIHAHCVLGRPDGSAVTGHLLDGHVRPTLELFLTSYDAELHRHHDPRSGLDLIRGNGNG
jgi:predicted DNA-binding protein with PD1-like motif